MRALVSTAQVRVLRSPSSFSYQIRFAEWQQQEVSWGRTLWWMALFAVKFKCPISIVFFVGNLEGRAEGINLHKRIVLIKFFNILPNRSRDQYRNWIWIIYIQFLSTCPVTKRFLIMNIHSKYRRWTSALLRICYHSDFPFNITTTRHSY